MTTTYPRLRPRIAITFGDPSGIGPEIMVKAMTDPALLDSADFVVLAAREELAAAERAAGRSLGLSPTASETGIYLDEETTPFPAIRVAESSEAAGAWAQRQLRRALHLAKNGDVDAIVYAPLNKYSMHLAGMDAEDDLRWFAGELGYTGVTSEINVSPSLWTSRVTSHVPISRVSEGITIDTVTDAITLLHGMLADTGIPAPRIAVSALNPHAGEKGKFGTEEIEILAPAISRAREAGLDVTGPFASDTVFLHAMREKLNGVVTMYHDQGQIAMKLIGSLKGVTIAGGLPVTIATPAHGTAFNLVGTGTAGTGAVEATLQAAVQLATAKLRKARAGA